MEKNYLNRIQEILDKSGRTQLWLAQQIDVSTNTLSGFCRNESQPKLDTLYKIAEVLNIDIFKLLIPNKNSYQLMETLYTPTSKSEAEKLNNILRAMFENSHTTNISFFYSNGNVPFVVGKEMFNYLVSILEQDNLIRYSDKGGIDFTIRGYILVEDFEDQDVTTTKHIGYEKVWYQKLPVVD